MISITRPGSKKEGFIARRFMKNLTYSKITSISTIIDCKSTKPNLLTLPSSIHYLPSTVATNVRTFQSVWRTMQGFS